MLRPGGEEAARRFREFCALLTVYLGVGMLLTWYAVFVSASQQGWRVTFVMPFGEGPAELVLISS